MIYPYNFSLSRIAWPALCGFMAATSISCSTEEVAPQHQMEIVLAEIPEEYYSMELQVLKVEAEHDRLGFIHCKQTTKDRFVLDKNSKDLKISKVSIFPGKYNSIRLTVGKESKLGMSLGGTPTEFKMPNNQIIEIPVNFEIIRGGKSKLTIDIMAGGVKFDSFLRTDTEHEPGFVVSQTGFTGMLREPMRAFFLIKGSGKEYSGYSDAAGHFSFLDLSPGNYEVQVYANESGELIETVQNLQIDSGQVVRLRTIDNLQHRGLSNK